MVAHPSVTRFRVMSGLAVILPQPTKTPFNTIENPSMSEVAITYSLRLGPER
jgi:hypothetical protein